MAENGYDHKKIEKDWQDKWQEDKIYETKTDSILPKKYILDMFPYPSGDGLHVGHPRGYIATDVYSRMMRMQGYNVLHPMGWDAFGLPAENFAIKNKIHPRVAVEQNIARFKQQLSIIGLDYDWSREINTTDPNFYRWTQWIFLQMYKKGLAYESYEPINWCPSCQTGLANEDVESDGTCERCGTKVEKRPMRQWVLKITDYADRLLSDLDTLPKWPEGVKEAQRHWIGRKEGVEIDHVVDGTGIILTAFSAYPAWLYADTFLVIAPEHPLLLEIIKGKEEERDVLNFIEEIKNQSEIERAGKEKKGIFTGAYVIDPINKGEKMPVWVANFALMNFGTGIIRCSAHDTRDFEFAEKYKIPLKEVTERTDLEMPINAHENSGILKDSGEFTGRNIDPSLISEMVDYFVEKTFGRKKIAYKIKDWVFSRQRYWGEPIPIIHCEKCGSVGVPESDLPVKLPEVTHYEPTGTGESPLAAITDWVNVSCPKCSGNAKRETNTMPQWAGSSWYYLRYIDPNNQDDLISKDKEKNAMPVDVYVGGDHATRHLIYARFWHKFLFDIGVVSGQEPFPRLEFLGFILAEDGRKMSKRWKNVVNPDDMVERFGADAFRLYEMFIGPFENTVKWNTDGLVGTYRFLEKVWKISGALSDLENIELLKSTHRTIKKITEDIEKFRFNTAVSQMMILVNSMSDAEVVPKECFVYLLKILAPFAPHITEEIWHNLRMESSIHLSDWPVWKDKYLEDTTIIIPVQINGKRRGEVTVEAGIREQEFKEIIEKDQLINKYIAGKEIKKFIYVQGKIVNIVL